jgi:SAM-dependent methyltransferase
MNFYRTLKNLRIDFLIQKTFLGGKVPSVDGHKMMAKTESSAYEQVKIVFFEYYSISENDVIVDVGCGKGRIFNYLLYKGINNKMIGYEINKEVGNKTKKNLLRYKNVEIHSENIFDNFPINGNVFYLFNPFYEAMMTEFRERIFSIKDKNPIILYLNPKCIEVFNDRRFIYEIKDVHIPNYNNDLKLAIIRISGG